MLPGKVTTVAPDEGAWPQPHTSTSPRNAADSARFMPQANRTPGGSASEPFDQRAGLEKIQAATMGKLLVLFVTAFVDMVGLAMIVPLLPFYATQFGSSAAVVGVL